MAPRIMPVALLASIGIHLACFLFLFKPINNQSPDLSNSFRTTIDADLESISEKIGSTPVSSSSPMENENVFKQMKNIQAKNKALEDQAAGFLNKIDNLEKKHSSEINKLQIANLNHIRINELLVRDNSNLSEKIAEANKEFGKSLDAIQTKLAESELAIKELKDQNDNLRHELSEESKFEKNFSDRQNSINQNMDLRVGEKPPPAVFFNSDQAQKSALLEQKETLKMIEAQSDKSKINNTENDVNSLRTKIESPQMSKDASSLTDKQASDYEKSISTIPVDEGNSLAQKNPVPVSGNIKPAYPVVAIRKQIEGTVILDLNINTHGEVEKIIVQSTSGHKILDDAAVETAKKWKFTPGTSNIKGIPIKFLLQNNRS